MEKSTEILCKLHDGLFGNIHQTKYQGVFFGVAVVFVEVASINFLNGESNLIAFAGVFQDRKIFSDGNLCTPVSESFRPI